MRKTKEFELFGIIYESQQFPAVEAFDMIDYISIATPLEVLKYTSVVKYDGTRVFLTKENIGKEVKDVIGYAPAKSVLNAVMEIVIAHNFGFLNDWKGIKIPNRFVADSKTEKSTYMEPIIAQLITANIATYEQMETYYSLYDAFSMFDALLVKSVNEAYAQEKAAADSKQGHR